IITHSSCSDLSRAGLLSLIRMAIKYASGPRIGLQSRRYVVQYTLASVVGTRIISRLVGRAGGCKDWRRSRTWSDRYSHAVGGRTLSVGHCDFDCNLTRCQPSCIKPLITVAA